MKRNSSDSITGGLASCTKYKVETNEQPLGQIFSIARVEKISTADASAQNFADIKSPDSLEHESDKIRVGVSSKVNFSKLTPKEQYIRFSNQAQEIKRLRKKLGKYTNSKGKKESSELQKAIEKVKSAKYELEDQSQLIENIIKAINSGKVAPNTLAYNQICTILRDVLAIQCPDSKYSIKLPEGTVPISCVEYEEYAKLPCTPAVLRSLIGREHRVIDDLGQLLRALHTQALTSIIYSKGGQGNIVPSVQ